MKVKIKVSIKRKIIIKIKETISKIILYFLYKGFQILYKYDENLKYEINNLEDNFSIKLQLKNKGYSLILVKTSSAIKRVKSLSNPDIVICFKSVDSAFNVLIGRIGISTAYARHSFTLKGDISTAISIVRCINIIEAYLFPKFITKNILKEIPKKNLSIISTYIHVLINN